jgi:hypothetical protein
VYLLAEEIIKGRQQGSLPLCGRKYFRQSAKKSSAKMK